MNLLKDLFKSDYDRAIEGAASMAKKMTPANVYFTSGRELGFQEGFKAAMDNRVKDTRELSPEEDKMLLEFLINNDIELIYSDEINGMRARKTKFGWKDAGVKYEHKPPVFL